MLNKEIAEKLGLAQDATPDMIAKVLGVYKVFIEKEGYTQTITKKVGEYAVQNNELSKKVETLETTAKTTNEQLTSATANIKKIIEGTWKANHIKGDIPYDKIDLSTLDYANFDKSIVKIANDNGLKVETSKEDLKTPNGSMSDNNLRVSGTMVY